MKIEEAYAPDPLNDQASVLVDAQTDIKIAVKQQVLSGKGVAEVKAEVKRIIDRAIARIRSPTLKEDGRISLMKFADNVYSRFVPALSGISAQLLSAVVIIMRAVTAGKGKDGYFKPRTAEEQKAASLIQYGGNLTYNVYNKGVPLQEFSKVYISRVSKALDGLAESVALDPNDVTGKNSLRNLAEMQVRYERHQEEIAGFRERGTRLVVCSAHADCSDRCAEWQGRVYSMDGSEGDTEDGRHFVPLERATDVYYTTKAGRTYKNGLLGFNCRHKLLEFKPGMAIPTLTADDRKREYEITKRQREMERGVIDAREEALSLKDVDIEKHAFWKKEAARRFEVYKAYSKEAGRAYYPDRVKIL